MIARRLSSFKTLIVMTLGCLTFTSGTGKARAFEPVLGEWAGTGLLFGRDAAFSMKWESVLGGRFVRLTFQNRMTGTDGTVRSMDAQAFYAFADSGAVEGTWFDSRGKVLPLEGTFTDSSLTVHWGEPESEQGRTIYRVTLPGGIHVEDFFLKGGTWHPFGEADYTRTMER